MQTKLGAEGSFVEASIVTIVLWSAYLATDVICFGDNALDKGDFNLQILFHEMFS